MVIDKTNTNSINDPEINIPDWLIDNQQGYGDPTPSTPERGHRLRNLLLIGSVAVGLCLGAQSTINFVGSIAHAQEVTATQHAEDDAEALLQSQILEASKNVIGLDNPNIVGDPIDVQAGGGFIRDAKEIVESQPDYDKNKGQIDYLLNESGKDVNSLGVNTGDVVAVVKGDANGDGKPDYVFNKIDPTK